MSSSRCEYETRVLIFACYDLETFSYGICRVFATKRWGIRGRKALKIFKEFSFISRSMKFGYVGVGDPPCPQKSNFYLPSDVCYLEFWIGLRKQEREKWVANLEKASFKVTTGWKTLMALAAALPLCLADPMNQVGRCTSLTSLPDCRLPKLNPSNFRRTQRDKRISSLTLALPLLSSSRKW